MVSRRTRRIVLAVLTAVFAFAGLGAWAIASPVGAAPDDDYHLASIWCGLGDREGLCAPGDQPNERVVSERLIESSGCFAQQSEKSAQCALDDSRMISTERGNFVGAYPPVFYAVMSVFATPDIAVSTVVMRLVNAGLFVGAVFSVLALLRPGQRGPIIWTSVVALVPLGVFIIPSVNPSSWALLAGLLVWVANYGYFTATTLPRRIALGAITVVIAVMGAGTRGDSAVFVAFAALAAMILTFEKNRVWLKKAILSFAVIVIGAFFFLASGQSTGAAVATVTQGGATAVSADELGAATESGMGLVFSNLLDLPWLWTGGTGTWGLGWFDTPLVKSVWVLMIGVLFAIVLWGLRVTSMRKGIVLILAFSALVVIPLYVLHGEGARVGDWVQPRYMLPLLIILIGLAIYGFAHDHLGLSRLQAGVLFAAVALANSLSLRNNMRRYITGTDVGGFNLNHNMEWWWDIPVSPMLVWFGGSGAFALTLLGAWLWLYPKGVRPVPAQEEISPELRRSIR
ncbi:DUF2142 domain-containing protein [Leucobacter sp. UT-8R-CII-1-4]|uniref:DUF2142 domain-containing protein n=1 Tax=Leucobacter sp. UT-8R-CII-1-4 TaxID=3040075 RepID=UPI0024A8B15B|nr:DUF2142 domain-containing protein [Leucobacter sp. UT-8R-CII-1-4]MDI6023770.1 DUF2142 domain-containing protein [Leucobacter sp. UT-8R-CII-1-4]